MDKTSPILINTGRIFYPIKKIYEAIDIPILSITGYYDDDQTGAMYYYDNHQKYGNAKAKAGHYLLAGPYSHGGAQWSPTPVQNGVEEIEKEAQIPIYKYVIQWFDWVLKKKKKPGFIKGPTSPILKPAIIPGKEPNHLKNKLRIPWSYFSHQRLFKMKKRKDVLVLDEKKPAGNTSLTYRARYRRLRWIPPIYLLYLNLMMIPIIITSAYNLVFESPAFAKRYKF
jgi:hypothetical protein